MEFYKNILTYSFLTAIFCFFTANHFFQEQASRHFLPNQKLETALQKGDGCIVYTGDSRTATLTADMFERQLKKLGKKDCIADLSLGGVDATGQVIILREYLNRGKRPKQILMGYSETSLLKSEEVIGPLAVSDSLPLETVVGSEALVLLWSQFSDVFTHYPGFPLRHFDSGFRFSLLRLSAFGIFPSLLWKKVQENLRPFSTEIKKEGGLVAESFSESQKKMYLEFKPGNPVYSVWIGKLKTQLDLLSISFTLFQVPLKSEVYANLAPLP
jgi:hypothetical protein